MTTRIDPDLVGRLARLGAARNRDVDTEVRTVTITDDEALEIANALTRPASSDERRAAVERYCRWHLGSASWAHAILSAFNNPADANAALDQAGAPQ